MRPSIRDDAARSDDRLKHTEGRQGRGSAAGHGRDGEVGRRGEEVLEEEEQRHDCTSHNLARPRLLSTLQWRVSASRRRSQLVNQSPPPPKSSRGRRHLAGSGLSHCPDSKGCLVSIRSPSSNLEAAFTPNPTTTRLLLHFSSTRVRVFRPRVNPPAVAVGDGLVKSGIGKRPLAKAQHMRSGPGRLLLAVLAVVTSG